MVPAGRALSQGGYSLTPAERVTQMPTIPAVWSVTDKTFVQIGDAEPGHTAVASREVPRDDTGSVAVPNSVPTQEPLLTRLLWASWCFFPNPRLDCRPWEALRSLGEQGLLFPEGSAPSPHLHPALLTSPTAG